MSTGIYKGIVFPEEIILDKVGILVKNLQTNVPLLKEILQQKDQLKRDSMLNTITQRGIRFSLGYPRMPAEIPFIAVTVANSTEDQVLSDEMDIRIVTNPEITATLVDGITIRTREGTIVEIDTTVGTVPTTGIIQIDDECLSYDTGSDTHITIRRRHVLNTDRSDHTPTSPVLFQKLEKLIGSYENMTVRVDVMDDNGDMVIFLGNLIRALFRATANKLHDSGLINLSISATDYAARPEFIPAEIYMRTTALNFTYAMTYPADAIKLITEATGIIEPPMVVVQDPNVDGRPV